MEKCINLANNTATENSKNNEWKTVINKKNKPKQSTNKNIIYGKNSNIQGVPKLAHLHVYRIDPKTTPNELTDMLKKNIPEVKCESLTQKYPELYSSFKVSFYEDNFSKAMDPELWPFCACINRFFHVRPKAVSPVKHGLEELKKSDDKVFISLSYTPKAVTLKKKFGNLPIKLMRVKIENEQEFKILEKVVRRGRFNLVDKDPDGDLNRLEAGPSSSKKQKYIPPPPPPPAMIEEFTEENDHFTQSQRWV
ncbi:unnamed protein product [Brassicogethes aeneus]|uniref:Uncharacterized protein n=1 Tax=Brassicogethes aeneus TaxID=1431903 RepID=A0A9P0FML5_BRAAE|nr:unnamed protein product [Brassicogethes aeneus]